MAECTRAFQHIPTYELAWLSLMEAVLGLGGANPRYALGADALEQVEQPVLFIWGDSDPFGSLEVARQAEAVTPKAKLVEWQGGHIPWWDDVETCGRLVREFMSE